jgi:hypothetical protein
MLVKQAFATYQVNRNVRAWRNGSRNGLKIRFSKGSAGSSPAARTNLLT